MPKHKTISLKKEVMGFMLNESVVMQAWSLDFQCIVLKFELRSSCSIDGTVITKR
jgi:hypothetical protein